MKRLDKYAIYLRKSRADVEAEKLGEGETLARHRKILTELAARKGLYVETEYHEIVSGETIAARPEIQKLINECYAGKYRGIIIIDVDRLSRGNQGDMQTIMDCLKFSNNRDGLLVVNQLIDRVFDTQLPKDEILSGFVIAKICLNSIDKGYSSALALGHYFGHHDGACSLDQHLLYFAEAWRRYLRAYR